MNFPCIISGSGIDDGQSRKTPGEGKISQQATGKKPDSGDDDHQVNQGRGIKEEKQETDGRNNERQNQNDSRDSDDGREEWKCVKVSKDLTRVTDGLQCH